MTRALHTKKKGKTGSALRQNTLLLCALLLVIALLPLTQAAQSYQEGIHLLRPESKYIDDTYSIPEYLTVEDITFVSCLEEEEILRNSLLCLDDNSFEDLESTEWSLQDNCYISSYNLEEFECQRLVIQAEYTKDEENYKMTKVVRVNKLSKVLDKITETQYSDGGWKDPLSTAYGIWALSYFKDIYDYQLDLAMEWLKLNRNNEEKCWPKSPCNVEMSANILSLLTLSNYTGELYEDEDARRVVNDARNWLEEKHNNYDQQDEWTVAIKAVNENTTLTLVAYDTEIFDENFTLPLSEEKNYTFKAEEERRIIVISDDYITADIINQEGQRIIQYQGDNLSYNIPGACWSLNKKGEPCDDTTSMLAMSTPIEEEQKENAKTWARKHLKEGAILGNYFGSENSVTDSALYLYNLYEDDHNENYLPRLMDWILYTQNNEGSWDDGTTAEKAIPTAYAVLSLYEAGYNRTSEPIEDAEKWISDNEENITKNNTIALSSAFYLLKHNARPLLVAEPKVLLVDKQTMSINLFNPTTFELNELTYEFSEELQGYLSIEPREELGAYSYRKIRINRNPSATQDAYGFLHVKNAQHEIAKIPIIISDTPTLNITFPENLIVFGTTGQLQLQVKKSGHEFVCRARFNSNEIASSGSVKLQKETAILAVTFTQALTKEDIYSGTLVCNAAGKELEFPFSIFVQRYAQTPLSVNPRDLIVNTTTKNPIIQLSNNLDRDLDIAISMDRYGSYFGFRKDLLLGPNEAYNLTITNNLPTDLNLTSTVLLQFNMLGRTETVSMLVDISQTPPPVKNPLTTLIPLIFIVIILGVAGYFAWKFKDVIIAELNKLNVIKTRTEKKKESEKIQLLKKSEQHQAIINVLNIMKFQDKDEKEIAKRLLQNFEKRDVKAALEQAGLALPALDEEEPEKVS